MDRRAILGEKSYNLSFDRFFKKAIAPLLFIMMEKVNP